MRVIVTSTFIPFVQGGSTVIFDSLVEALTAAGHEVEPILIPFHSHPAEMLSQMLAIRLLPMSEEADRVIAIRTPSYLVRHPHKRIWFIHHHRGAYDLWGTEYQDIPNTPEGSGCRAAIVRADTVSLQEAERVFANSEAVAKRLKAFNGIEAEVLYPPVWRPDSYRCGDYGEYFFFVARITKQKRQALAIEAMRHTKSPVQLVIAGAPDPAADDYLRHITSLVYKYQLESRVTIIPRWIPEEEKLARLADCLGVLYVAINEDSYGYSALEAHEAGKPVITTTDGGGTEELIRDRETGFIAPPDPKQIAELMDQLYENRSLARQMGASARQRIRDMGITWPAVLSKLVS